MWGLFPLYFHALEPSTPLEIVANRIVWSLVVVLLILRDFSWVRHLTGPAVRRLVIAAVLLSTNWLVYIWAVETNQVVEGALGYFINPLVTVTLGVVVLGEHLRRPQWVAVGLGTVAVVVLTWSYGRVPWIALVLAFTFAGYGFQKKQSTLTAAQSLAGETAVLAPLALIVMIAMQARGTATFGSDGVRHALLLMAAGPITAAPLLCFAAAARRIPLTMLGLLQYLTPIGQFILGVAVFHEQLTPSRWVGFVLVWAALAVLTVDALGERSDQRVTA